MSWSQDDRDKAITMFVRDRMTCSQCGTRPDEWDPAQGGDRRAYVPEINQCLGCQTLSQASERLKDEHRGRGYHAVLKRNPKAGGRSARGE